MGNCIVLQEKIVRVMKTDGKILEYKSPIKVHQVLSEFPHHAISDKLPVIKHLHPNTEMLQGHLYYLLPLPVPPQPDVLELGDGGENGVVRIKVVISKQELQAILSNGGVSVDDVISKVQKKDDLVISKGWSPTLESIPEVN
ncbi:hypothetical protein DH2020_039846 [Rehmannia glutinosa]|uniref:Uncharacterized protein n=1 Tax=Rehmannia glutinosa TaxID=99300 RepID=A0ABR0UV70_REHGL